MGRWYSINIGGGQIAYTSPEGDANSALNVELDITLQAVDVADPGAYFRIWGIPLQYLGPNYNLLNKSVSISGGMSAGLPLAKPAQRGVLASGSVWQCFGNAIGLDRTLDVIFNPGAVAPQGVGPNPKPQTRSIVLNWKKGKPLQQALQNSLQQAFPDIQLPSFTISPQLIAVQDQVGFYQNLQQFSLFIRRASQNIMGGSTYPGVSIAVNAGQFVIDDGTAPQAFNGTIAFEDLIGQPTWITANTIQFKTVMRADIKVLNTVKLPPGPVTYAANSYPSINQTTLFNGTFQVSKIRHVGNFRQPDAASWVTIFDAFSTSQANVAPPPSSSVTTTEPSN